LAFPVPKSTSGEMRGRTAYSCGGSHGIGPLWVRRTVFPFDPLVPLHAGNRHGTTYTPLEGAGSMFRQAEAIAPGITEADSGDSRRAMKTALRPKSPMR